jgi:hypothetical protein
MGHLTPITPEDAAKNHGVTTHHTVSKEGEHRFRLLKHDGTAYIRTEAAPEGRWQNAHWHSKVRETYIVQKEHLFYVERRTDGEPTAPVRYEAGEMFTSAAEVIHDVYLPPEAVIHTVKHGEAKDEERLEDARTEAFTELLTTRGTEPLGRARRPLPAGSTAQGQAGAKGPYNQVYLHFDRLIWQVPAWATAIVALVFAGLARLRSDGPLVEFIRLPVDWILALLMFLFGCVLLVLSHALYRFRWHQIRSKWYVPEHPLRSPQVWLQAAVNFQAFALLFLPALPLGSTVVVCYGVFIVAAFAVWTLWREKILLREGRRAAEDERSSQRWAAWS